MKRIVFALLLLAGSNARTNAQQIGINTNNPNPLTVLDIRNVSNATDSISYRGVMVPRMTEAERNKINVLDTNNANGLLIYNTDEDCFNYYNRNQTRWRSLCGENDGLVQINQVYCDRMTSAPMGNLVVGTPLLQATHSAGVLLEVAKAGTYEILITPFDENGYYFYDAGAFLFPGLHFTRAFGTGVPIYGRTDSLNVYINGDFACSSSIAITVNRLTAVSAFTLQCNSITVNGNYIVGEMLNTNNNTVQVTATVNAFRDNSPYRIRTDTVNGYYFEGTGVFVSGIGSRSITLYSNGTPQNTGTDTFILYTNSNQATNETRTLSCTFEVNITTL